MKPIFLDRFSTNSKTSNVMKVHPVGGRFYVEERRMDRHDEANSHFSQFCERE
jgi:hypothetical protein